ncbi:MAG: efflux transporter outer membrane subunit [Nitrospirae bacterium]|nr:efflux transporter outer membrane subunit [Nitrospirota bacterium]
MTRKIHLIMGVLICLVGCSLAPKYTKPAAPVPADWPTGEAYKGTKAAAGAPAASELRWQEFFTDTKLQQIIEMALNNNRDLKLAALNVEKARAIYGIQRAEIFPVVNAVGSESKKRGSLDIVRPGELRTTEQYSVNLGITSWEIDFFGRIRSLKDVALQEYLATEHARRSAQISLISAVANTYLSLAADLEILKLAKSTLDTQQAAYDLIKRRYDVGLASALDLRRAQTQVDTARGDVARYTQLAAQGENALNLLVGSPIPKDLLPIDLITVSPPKEISPGISSEALLRRPDVLQAETLLKAANANIGAARAAFFPRISLTGAIGTASDELSGLFKTGTGTWSFTPQINMPIFDARTWSALESSKVDREIVLTQYEKAIQTAFREVADALAQKGTVGDQMAAQQSLVEAFAESYRLSDARYKSGIDSYLSVLDAQRSLYSAQQGLITVRLSKLTNLVTLYKVLGGGEKD